MAYATPADVAAELGRPTFTDPAQIAQINAWLERVEAAIVARIPDLAARIADPNDPLTTDLVANVEAAVVARKVLNPSGERQQTIAVDDGSVTKLRQGPMWDGDLTLMDSEWALLDPPSGAFTIRPSGTGPVAFYNDHWPLRRC